MHTTPALGISWSVAAGTAASSRGYVISSWALRIWPCSSAAQAARLAAPAALLAINEELNSD